MKSVHGQALIQAFEQWVPKSLAMDGDKIGLQIGTLNKPIKKLMITLDVLENVVDEAIENEVDLIFAHHAVIFHPLKTMLTDEGQSKIVAKCIKHDIAVYVAHTNLDNADGGMNDWLANTLQLKDVEILVPQQKETLYKLVVYASETCANKIAQVLDQTGAEVLGKDRHCIFDKGVFIPSNEANNSLESVREVKIDAIVPERLLNRVKQAMFQAHPCEDVVYDIHALQNKGKTYGLGRIGYLETEQSLRTFAEQIKQVFELDGVRVIGDLQRKVKKVAVLGGDGNSFYKQAVAQGADVLVTGDIYYHTGHEALLDGLAMVDAGHYIEQIMKKEVGDFFGAFLMEHCYSTEVLLSKVNTNPFTFL